MAEKKHITINIINRNYPPIKGITGESAADLALYLSSRGARINVITIDNALYGGGGEIPSATGNIYGIKTFYNGKNKVIRLLSSIVEGYRLINRARSLKADWTIVMTDPPLLNFFASSLFKKNYKWILWSMDIYPDAFVAAGLLSKKNILIRHIEKKLKRYPPDAVIALGPVQKDFLKKNYYPKAHYFELPCGVFPLSTASTYPPEWRNNDSKIYLGYCGNIGEAHSLPFLKEIITQLDASKFTLILAPYGAKAQELRQFASRKEGVLILNSVSRNDLAHLDIHIATLLEKWVNVCVPSKAVSSACSGAAFLYHGITDSDNWILLQEAGWIVNPTDDLKGSISNFFHSVNKHAVMIKKTHARNIAQKLVSSQVDTYSVIAQKMNEKF